jgi:hypothetical protein
VLPDRECEKRRQRTLDAARLAANDYGSLRLRAFERDRVAVRNRFTHDFVRQREERHRVERAEVVGIVQIAKIVDFLDHAKQTCARFGGVVNHLSIG